MTETALEVQMTLCDETTHESGTLAAQRAGRLPDFLIIGSGKCGTTTLHEYLCLHPQVLMCPWRKEPEFFLDDALYVRGLTWYRSLWAGARPNQLCGEATTSYCMWPHTPDCAARMAKAIPSAKLIYIMRHPVERTYSHYVQSIKKAQRVRREYAVTRTFEEALDQTDLFVDPSMYLQQIERYLQHYPRESFLFLLFEDFRKDPAATLQVVQRFLGVEERDLTQTGLIRANTAAEHSRDFLRSRLTAPLRAIPLVGRVARTLPQRYRDSVHEFLKASPYGRWAQRRYVPRDMLPETRARLLRRFEEPNRRLAAFLGRDLSAWSR